MLDQLSAGVDSASPIGTLASGHALNEGWTVLLRHRSSLFFVALLYLDAADECVHGSSLAEST